MKISSSKILLKYLFRLPEDYLVPFGPLKQPGALMATVDVEPIWQELSFTQKLKAVVTFQWKPDEALMHDKAIQILQRDVFGLESDFGDVIHDINLLHHHREWPLDELNESDDEKVNALMSVKILTALKHYHAGTNDALHLNLVSYNPLICTLVIPMMAKIPVVSLRFGLEIQENYTFNAIRSAKHPQADDLIAFLYETLTIQQKLSRAFHRLLYLMSQIQQEKGDSSLTGKELEALSECDSIINYLKASVEKTVLILALTFGITDLDSKQKHSQKLRALDQKIPPLAKSQHYFGFLWKFIQSDELDKLNSLRNGLNHKKGVSNLQPHSYLNKGMSSSPIAEHFHLLLDQHRKNTAILLCTLALLVDDLMFRKPPLGPEIEFCSDLMNIYAAYISSDKGQSDFEQFMGTETNPPETEKPD